MSTVHVAAFHSFTDLEKHVLKVLKLISQSDIIFLTVTLTVSAL